MAISKPFHRNVRGVKPAQNSGYSGWAFIRDREYARAPEHYVRALLIILADLQAIFEFVEPGEESRTAYSYRIHALLMRTCIEVEANFRAILDENIFTHPQKRQLNMSDYRKVDQTHHLSSYEAMLPIWNGTPPILKPFGAWRTTRGQSGVQHARLPWYQIYNASKHDRQEAFKKANLETLVEAVAGLLVLISSQFRSEDFSAAADTISMPGYAYHSMEPSTGSLFRIQYPDDWDETEVYEFDWMQIKHRPDRFGKIDFDAID